MSVCVPTCLSVCLDICLFLTACLSFSMSVSSLSHPSSCTLVDHGPSQQSCKEEYELWKRGSHKILHILLQRSCFQRENPCQDSAGNRTTQRPPDHHKEMQTVVVWSCLLFIRSGKKHLARHSEWGKKTRQTKEEVGRQHQGRGRPGDRQVPEGSEEHRRMAVSYTHLTLPTRIRV